MNNNINDTTARGSCTFNRICTEPLVPGGDGGLKIAVELVGLSVFNTDDDDDAGGGGDDEENDDAELELLIQKNRNP